MSTDFLVFVIIFNCYTIATGGGGVAVVGGSADGGGFAAVF